MLSGIDTSKVRMIISFSDIGAIIGCRMGSGRLLLRMGVVSPLPTGKVPCDIWLSLPSPPLGNSPSSSGSSRPSSTPLGNGAADHADRKLVGGAIGAAAYVQSQVTNHQSPTSDLRPLTSAYFGPASSEAEIHTLLDWRKRKIADAGCTVALVPDEQELLRRTAQSIVDGKIVGWFQERMEWGPSALGNRSILADPRRADMKDLFSA